MDEMGQINLGTDEMGQIDLKMDKMGQIDCPRVVHSRCQQVAATSK